MSDKDNLVITITGYTAADAKNWINKRVGEEVSSAIKEAVEKQVNAAIKETIAGLTDDDIKARLSNEVDIVLEEGWRETDNYGSACGPPISLKDRISKMLGAKAQGGYDKTAGQAILERAYKDILKPEVEKHARELRKQLEARAEKVMREYLSSVLRRANSNVLHEIAREKLADLLPPDDPSDSA